MTEQPGLGFGGLLRQLRDEAGLTQDELAEAAQVSQRAISDLERGINATARKDTAVLLAGALGLDGLARELFIAAARGRGPAEAVLSARQESVLGVFAPTRAARHNLPAQLTSFVGREPELPVLDKLLGGARLVTLTGAGGVGKTRLAVEFAAGVTGRFRDGVWLAELAGITDPGLVASVVMEVLGARQDGDVPVIDALRWRLRSAELLLVLDNCEHLLDACADLAAALLSGSPGLRVLATSREVLGVPGEVACSVPPLAVPAGQADPAVAAGAPAVRLFVDRGSTARAGAGLAGAPVAAIARICRELDGLPLAIELAAARTSVLSVEEIETHLGDKFAFLASRRPVGNPRHQALKATIDWSYQLLPVAEQHAFRQLSVFAAGFGLEQAAAVCCGGDLSAVLDVVDRLAGKSLIAAETAAGRTRYRLLDTIREYAAGRLAEAGEAEAARRRHTEAFLALAERERDLDILGRELDDFRATLEWSLAHDSQAGPRLARALGAFWLARGFLHEGERWLERALAADPPDPQVRADLHRSLGSILYQVAELPRAEATLAEGARIATAARLAAAQARISVVRSEIRVMHHGADAESLSECEAAAALLEAEGDGDGLADAWLAIGIARGAHYEPPQEAFERAIRYARESGNHRVNRDARCMLVGSYLELPIPADAAVARAEQFLDEAGPDDPWGQAAILEPSSVLYAHAGRFADARAAIARAQSLYRGLETKLTPSCALCTGEIEMAAGNPVAAEPELRKGCQGLRAFGNRGILCSSLSWLAEAVYAQGRLDEAQQLTQQAEAISPGPDRDAQTRWRAVRAKVLAQRGQSAAARHLADEAAAIAAPSYSTVLQAYALEAQAEVSRLAGAPEEAASRLREALRLYQERRALALADRTRAALASLSADLR